LGVLLFVNQLIVIFGLKRILLIILTSHELPNMTGMNARNIPMIRVRFQPVKPFESSPPFVSDTIIQIQADFLNYFVIVPLREH